MELSDIEAHSRLTDGGRLSALRAGRLYPQEDSWYSFLLKAEGHNAAGRVRSTENPIT
jgi:hypothetical protein